VKTRAAPRAPGHLRLAQLHQPLLGRLVDAAAHALQQLHDLAVVAAHRILRACVFGTSA